MTTIRAAAAVPTANHLLAEFRRVRAATEMLCVGLEPEDLTIQPMDAASPLKWHLAHTTWFFETFLLLPRSAGYQPFDPVYAFLFNSYYHTVGPQHPRARRGALSRPTVREILAYRQCVDEAVVALFLAQGDAATGDLAHILTVGLNHEQQHQELMLTDLKHLFALNPLQPAYRSEPTTAATTGPPPSGWHDHPGGLVAIGHAGEDFAWDNEGPRHRVYLEPFALARKPVTCGEYLEFMADGGYEQPLLWFSDGWDTARAGGWSSPLYWQRVDGVWHQYTLAGPRAVVPDEPICHVSFYEAHAYARWRGARLASEAEWETIAAGRPVTGNFVESGRFQPAPAGSEDVAQMFGDTWEWTASPYIAYPGYAPPVGALGEYNAKFMCNQMVLRGGSCATPAGHVRATYRNFFGPATRWQFSGIRLARGGAAA